MSTSTCPTCGYVFAPFETSCPRCADTASHPAAEPTAPSTGTTHSMPDIILAELGLLFSDIGRLLVALVLVPVLFVVWILVEKSLHLRGELMLLGMLVRWGGLAAIIAVGARIAPRRLWLIYFITLAIGFPLGLLALIPK